MRNKMSFYVERIIIHNRAPFEHIDLEFKDNRISGKHFYHFIDYQS